MAFEFEARVECRKRGTSKTVEARAAVLDQWVQRQTPVADTQLVFNHSPQ